MKFNFFKKKQYVVDFEFNKTKLELALVEVLNRMAQYRGDESIKDIREMIQILKNDAVLTSAYARDEKERVFHQAKIECFNGFEALLEQAINRVSIEKKEGKKQVRGTFNSVRKSLGLAGSSI